MFITTFSLLICVLPVIVFGFFGPSRISVLTGFTVLAVYSYYISVNGWLVDGGSLVQFGLFVVWAAYLVLAWRKRTNWLFAKKF